MSNKDLDLGPLASVTRELGEDDTTLVFQRLLRHPPEKVWRVLTLPEEQLEWAPFVSDRPLDSVGPAQLRMTDGSDDTVIMDGAILICEPPSLLSYRWGDDLLTWRLAPQASGTLLTLRHATKTPDHLSSFAAGWHICVAVAERFMDGRRIGRVVGPQALAFGWSELNDQYDRQLGQAQGQTMNEDDANTCGKGIAANAVLPERIAELLEAMAGIYTNHIRALDPKAETGRQEISAYEHLADNCRRAATNVSELADAMRSYRDLPMADHDFNALSDAQSILAMDAIVRAQQALLAPLSERATEFSAMLDEMKRA